MDNLNQMNSIKEFIDKLDVLSNELELTKIALN